MATATADKQALDLTAEQCVLGAILLERGTFQHVRPMLEPEHFAEPGHAAIYRAMCDLADRVESVDLLTVAHEVESGGTASGRADVTYLAELVDAVVDTASVGTYARIVREAADRQTFARTLEGARRRVEDGERALDVAAWLQDECRATLYTRTADGFEVGAQLADALEWDLSQAVSLELAALADQVAPLDRGAQVIIGGTPGSGKTALLTQVLLAQAGEGLRVSLLSAEMPYIPIARRLISQLSGVPEWHIKSKELSADELSDMSRAAEAIKAMPFRFVDCAGMGPRQLLATAEAEFRRADVVGFDYLQLCRGGGERRDEIDSLSAGFKALARRHDGVSIICSQLKRTGNETRKPRVSDLKESGALEADADTVLLLSKPENGEQSTREIIVGKQRHGEAGHFFEVRFNGQCYQFTEL